MMRQLIGVRRLPVVSMIAAILTVLSGLGMYWRNYSLSHGVWASSTQGMTFGTGAVFGLITLGVGMGVLTPAAKKLTELTASIASAGGPPTAEQAATMAALQGRMLAGGGAGAGVRTITGINNGIARYL